MRFLDGWKTWLGALTTAAAIIVPSLGGDAALVPAIGQQVGNIIEHGSAIVAGVGVALASLGLVHKAEKRRDASK